MIEGSPARFLLAPVTKMEHNRQVYDMSFSYSGWFITCLGKG